MSDKTVTIELPDGALAGWPVLLDALRQAREQTGYVLIFGDLIEQIERQTTPPKPEEPMGLGAVVATEAGEDYIRVRRGPGNPWLNLNPWLNVRTRTHCCWDRVDVVRVLSEGVTA